MEITEQRSIDLQIIKIKMPLTVHGVSAVTGGGNSYLILINSEIPEAEQQRAFLHEMRHIYNGDHENPAADINELERRAHAQDDELTAILQRG